MKNGQIGIYAIWDIIAMQIVGILQMHRADAAAIRFFTDVATDPNTLVNKHPEHFNLLLLGAIDELNIITPGLETILTGAAWLAATHQTPTLERENT